MTTAPHTILIIEDHPDIAALLQLTLHDAGYQTLHADSGASGLIQAREGHPDLVLLDLGLPDFPGDEVARRLRSTSDLPILVLTAVDDHDRRVDLLSSGVNDYVIKPFDPQELIARIRVQFRQRGGPTTLNLGGLSVDRGKRRCTFEGRDVPLSPREFELLEFLACSPGRVHTREEIAHTVWHNPQLQANVIDVHMSNLRGKLRDSGAYGVIRTVRGVGFAVRAPASTTRRPGVST